MQSSSDVSERGRPSRAPWIVALVTTGVCAAVTFHAWAVSRRAEAARVRQEFRAEAQAIQQLVDREFRLFFDVLHSITVLHSLSERVSSQDFEEFVLKGMKHQESVLGAFGFAQRIPSAFRGAFERSQQQMGNADFRIVQRDARGAYVPADPRPDLFPLTFQTPRDGLRAPIGFDFGSDAANRAAVDRMARQGLPAVGGAVGGGHAGHYAMSPILYSFVEGQFFPAPGFLMGFAAAILDPQRILERALEGRAAGGIVASLVRTEGDAVLREGEGEYVSWLTAANARWEFRCAQGPDFAERHETGRPGWVLITGGVITLAVGAQLVLVALRTRRIERLVQKRTTALHEANRRLHEEMGERLRLESELLEIGNREKQRVGRDLHDSLGQKLTGAVFLSRALAQRLAESGAAEGEDAARINDILKDSVAQVRRIARGLAPVELGRDGLPDALSRLADETGGLFEVSCLAHSDADLRVSERVGVHLYHVAQEAVNNAVRHGKARHIEICLGREGATGQLTIEDDGSGMVKAAAGSGMGLKIMRYRAEMIGGELDVRRSAMGGVLVECRFPCEEEEEKS